jgi:peptidoglycan/LPS O-acetylase OafA/YrhL
LLFIRTPTYRKDIDGLRAIAVVPVILFHFGYAPVGFLGVDVFFVISGFLITGIILEATSTSSFSMVDFYVRRVRRIMPLSLIVCAVALAMGVITMLPDDLENLAQSVVATNFFSNNVLQAVTTRNYWDVVNEYKPLMHTWSLGVEEQFYAVYPLMLVLLIRKNRTWAISIMSVMVLASLALYLSPFFSEYQKFYLIFFRFWELGLGGIAAIAARGQVVENRYSVLPVILLVCLLFSSVEFLSDEIGLITVVLLTILILVSSNSANKFTSVILENRVMVFVGKISFSLYMWHQVVLAFARYFWVQILGPVHLLVVLLLTVALSTLTYFLVEKPFRDKNKVGVKPLFLILGFVFLLTTISSLYIYSRAGVLSDIPELGVTAANIERGIHKKYNQRIYDYDYDFNSELVGRHKILVIGNSFARDWANVLLESQISDKIQISYVNNLGSYDAYKSRLDEADVIFYSTPSQDDVRKYKLPESKLWAVGTKNFGVNNGIFYNRKGPGYYEQRTPMEEGYLKISETMRGYWKGRYLDYIGKVIDENDEVPVFTPSGQFISQDCRHFTRAGAVYFSTLFEEELDKILIGLN